MNACDTMLILQNLLQDPQQLSYITIPLSTSCVRGVLECQLHAKFKANNDDDTVVTQELPQLLQTSKVCQLAALSSSKSSQSETAIEIPPITLLVLTTEYLELGVKDALAVAADNAIDGSTMSSSKAVVNWFIDNFHKLLQMGKRISIHRMEQLLRNNGTPSPNCSASTIAKELQRLQVLMPCNPQHTGSFQLWLPNLGRALEAFEHVQRNIIQSLQRSNYNELSYTSLIQKQSSSAKGRAIPALLVLDWLVANNILVAEERPAGKFVRLVAR